jgi:hypothetical protein
MFAVYAKEANLENPLALLVLGERPDPVIPEGWVRVKMTHVGLNQHDVFTLPELSAQKEPISFPKTSYYCLGVLAEPIVADTGWALSTIFLGFSVALLVMGFISTWVGRFIDRIGARAHGGDRAHRGRLHAARSWRSPAIAPSRCADQRLNTAFLAPGLSIDRGSNGPRSDGRACTLCVITGTTRPAVW